MQNHRFLTLLSISGFCVDSAVLAVLKCLARKLLPRGKKITASEAVDHVVKFLSVSFSEFIVERVIQLCKNCCHVILFKLIEQ